MSKQFELVIFSVRPELVEGWTGKITSSIQRIRNMFWIYILRCADGSYYTGHTDNLEKRMVQHQAGEFAGYTASRRPLQLVWSQECSSREEALSAERQIKGWSRKKKEAMMRGDWSEVSRLAQSKSIHPSTSSGRTDLLLRHIDHESQQSINSISNGDELLIWSNPNA